MQPLDWDDTARPDEPGWYATLNQGHAGADWWDGGEWAHGPYDACSWARFVDKDCALAWAEDKAEAVL
jgi:hypothetical protein